MRKKLTTLSLLIAGLSLVGLTPVGADAPTYGDMDLQFDLGWSGPSDVAPIWVGTVTIDDVEYGMAFFNIGSGKPFDADPNPNVAFFGEIWKVYEGLEFEFDENGVLTGFVEGEVLLWGYDEGVVTFANSKYRMNGSVEGASGPFAALEGYNVHMNGIIELYPFGAPQFAPGTLRIN